MSTIPRAMRRSVVQVLKERYKDAPRAERERILDELVRLTGYHRKYAIQVLSLRRKRGGFVKAEVRGRPRIYDQDVREALTVLWEAADRVCGKRLKALLPLLVPALERHGHVQLDPTVRTKLLAASAASIDRLLQRMRSTTPARRTRLFSAVSKSIPVRTFADWHNPPPGSIEADLVAHCGDSMRGSFLHTLTLTDIATGWTECVPLLVRESTLVAEAIDAARARLPFPLRSLDTDNGREFISETLLTYCRNNAIEFTRSRPFHKNDQAWVEQKNGAVVRRLVGYRRLQGVVAAQVLTRLYTAARLFVNFFQPSFKLASKRRVGARVQKRYHPPQTPCQRLLASRDVTKRTKAQLQRTLSQLDPLQLLEEIRAMQSRLVTLVDKRIDVPTQDTLKDFLAGLSINWRQGESRPTHRPKPTEPRTWRSRIDPFESVWPEVERWLVARPDQNAKELFARLQHEYPGIYPLKQLRTLQRRVKEWRTKEARKLLSPYH